MLYNKKSETMSRDNLGQVQLERLQATINRVYRKVDFYHSVFDKAGINAESIKSLDDLRRLPFTTRDDLNSSYPYGMFAVPLHDIVRIQATSGSTGKPVAVGYTRNDINLWAELVARQLFSAGITSHDIVQVAFNYSLFTGGLGFHYGAEKLGAAVIPASSGRNIPEQIAIMKDYKATVLVSLPSYALAISHELVQKNISPDTLNLKVGLFGGEPWSESLRGNLETMLGLKAFDTYGLTEIIGPGIASECEEHNGLHISEDHFLVEVIDPVTMNPVKEGEEGELVFTTLSKEAFPLIRYRTRDIARLIKDQCPCGRSFVRMSRVSGRSDDMFFVSGVKLFPSQIREAISEIQELQPRCRLVLSGSEDEETLEIQVAMSDKVDTFDEIKNMEKLREGIKYRLETSLGISSKITFVEPESLDGIGEGKKSVKVERRQGLMP